MLNEDNARNAHDNVGGKSHGHEKKVGVYINGVKFEAKEGPTTVHHLKHLAEIPHDEILGREIGGKFHPFAQDGEVEVREGEGFLSRPKIIRIWVDKEEFKLDTHELTVAQIIELAGDDPTQTTLKLKEGNKLDTFSDQNQVLCLKNGERFVVFHNEPTPVS